MERISKENFVKCVYEIKRQTANLNKLDECLSGGDVWSSGFVDPIFLSIRLLAYCLAGDDEETEENLATGILENKDINWEKFYDNYTY